METDVNKDGALLYESEVHTQLFEFPLDLFAEIFTPKLCIFQIDIAYQLTIKIRFKFAILDSELVLSVGQFEFRFLHFFSDLGIFWAL